MTSEDRGAAGPYTEYDNLPVLHAREKHLRGPGSSTAARTSTAGAVPAADFPAKRSPVSFTSPPSCCARGPRTQCS
ncbi:DUF6420 family protein [Streptomyces sp. NPDC019990]|uniref:DUF6420 family protein n=1 Tax=Streptomyces sp. NPDC019990 TaxID=3154693 RepID=UPI00341165E3